MNKEDNTININEIFPNEIKKFDVKKENNKKEILNIKNNNENITPEENSNYIIAVYEINETELFKQTQILNCTLYPFKNNKGEIEEKCEIYLNEEKIKFDFTYRFTQIGKTTLKFVFKELMANLYK